MDLDFLGVQKSEPAHSPFLHLVVNYPHSLAGCWHGSIQNENYLKHLHQSCGMENCLQIDSKAPIPLFD
jgi:hypothetical protein